MAKFKKGDRVRRTIGEFCGMKAGHTGTVSWSEGNTVKFSEDEFYGSYSISLGGYELAEPTYTPITPEVGQKYRVVKGSFYFKAGRVLTMHRENGGWYDIKGSAQIDGYTNYLTTEYLELVEEPKGATYGGYIDKAQIAQDWATQAYETMIAKDRYSNHPIYVTSNMAEEELQDEPKLTTMQKLTSALKRALSSDKQALYKTGIINGGLELSGEGRTAYVNALFQNEGDHKAAMAEMVEAAKEEMED